MRLGFDVDGVLAEFCHAYEDVFVRQTGRNTFAPFVDTVGPVSWDWPTDHYGYTKEETSAVWEEIKADQLFCRRLPALPDMERLYVWLINNHRVHDIYFITSRVGPHGKSSTEDWLTYQGVIRPTVLIVRGEDKGVVAKALKLDLFVEDNLQNATVIGEAGVKSYLIDRAYNQGEGPVIRVPDISAVLSATE